MNTTRTAMARTSMTATLLPSSQQCQFVEHAYEGRLARADGAALAQTRRRVSMPAGQFGGEQGGDGVHRRSPVERVTCAHPPTEASDRTPTLGVAVHTSG